MKSHSAVVLAIWISLTFIASFVSSAPQVQPTEVSSDKYSPYSFEYKVEDAEQKLFHDRNESQDASGKVRAKSSNDESFHRQSFAICFS